MKVKKEDSGSPEAQLRALIDEFAPAHLRLVGAGRIAHPDPHQVIALDDRVAPHAQLRRDHVLAGDLVAAPGRVVPDAVIHAAHAVALAATPRQQRTAMRAAVVQRDKAIFGEDAHEFVPERWFRKGAAKMDRMMFQVGACSHTTGSLCRSTLR